MIIRIDDYKWIQNTAVEFFYIEETAAGENETPDAGTSRIVFGMRNGHLMRSKKFKTPDEAERFARTLISIRNQED
ncbi:MAG: hypothetical protein IJQ82_14075 [Selenomonadaceae bacterium]|nr:hypothetical protein [Selenomonadaceae bacterium]